MQDQIITLETAKLAKEKGFDIPTIYCYIKNHVSPDLDYILCDSVEPEKQLEAGQIGVYILPINWNNTTYVLPHISAPTQSLLQRWLREKHNIFITIDQHFEPIPNSESINKRGDRLLQHSGKYFLVVRPPGTVNPPNSTIKDSYEDALETGLLEALKLIKS